LPGSFFALILMFGIGLQFKVTADHDATLAFLLESNYLRNASASLPPTLSFIFASTGMSHLDVPSGPYIEFDRYTTVVVMLNGSISARTVSELEHRGTVNTELERSA
jgi:Na+/H+ antiporter NhaC